MPAYSYSMFKCDNIRISFIQINTTNIFISEFLIFDMTFGFFLPMPLIYTKENVEW